MLSITTGKTRTQNNYKYQRISDDKTHNKNDRYDSSPHRHHPKHLFYKIICINMEYLFIRFAFAVVHIGRIFTKPTLGFFRLRLRSQRGCVRAISLTIPHHYHYRCIIDMERHLWVPIMFSTSPISIRVATSTKREENESTHTWVPRLAHTQANILWK